MYFVFSRLTFFPSRVVHLRSALVVLVLKHHVFSMTINIFNFCLFPLQHTHSNPLMQRQSVAVLEHHYFGIMQGSF
jgi:hypothetical protein